MMITTESVSDGGRLAAYMHDKKNESSRVIELRGAVGDNLRDAFQEWNALAAPTRCQNPFLSASLNQQPHERMTDRDYVQAADILEKKLGLTGQPRAIIVQVNEKGRQHAHVVWSRIDLQTMTAISDSHYYHRRNDAAREIEEQLNLERWRESHHLGHGDMVSEQRAANAMFVENNAVLAKQQEAERQALLQDSFRDTAQCVPPEQAFQPENAAFLDHGKPIQPPQEHERPELAIPEFEYSSYAPELGNVFDDSATAPAASQEQQQKDAERQEVLRETGEDVPAEKAADAKASKSEERDVRSEINDLYRQHFPDSGNDSGKSNEHDHDPPEIGRSF